MMMMEEDKRKMKKGGAEEEDAAVHPCVQREMEEAEELRRSIIDLKVRRAGLTADLRKLKEEEMRWMRNYSSDFRKLERELQVSLEEGARQMEQARQEHLQASREEQQQVAALQKQLQDLDLHREELLKDREVLLRCKTVEIPELEQRVRELQSELLSEREVLRENAESCGRTLQASLTRLQSASLRLMEEQKQRAVRSAVRELEPSVCAEFLQNQLLKSQISLYRDIISTQDPDQEIQSSPPPSTPSTPEPEEPPQITCSMIRNRFPEAFAPKPSKTRRRYKI
ncbi:mediator of RNA polymerase II transcription subunit 15-like [Astyanax mexicanus]|uniref:Mediator of RNA polymerase II transcription subunit 15-like n=1 Tax=Astyanax mexicanus TaxID=7994 RepID=A0A8T2KJS6_ASTMX|nr:mediator of RNA polymerase II transcription subunit 15-like [Astyanax mexicanus]